MSSPQNGVEVINQTDFAVSVQRRPQDLATNAKQILFRGRAITPPKQQHHPLALYTLLGRKIAQQEIPSLAVKNCKALTVSPHSTNFVQMSLTFASGASTTLYVCKNASVYGTYNCINFEPRDIALEEIQSKLRTFVDSHPHFEFKHVLYNELGIGIVGFKRKERELPPGAVVDYVGGQKVISILESYGGEQCESLSFFFMAPHENTFRQVETGSIFIFDNGTTIATSEAKKDVCQLKFTPDTFCSMEYVAETGAHYVNATKATVLDLTSLPFDVRMHPSDYSGLMLMPSHGPGGITLTTIEAH